jgi:hypothetical protein
MGFADAAKIVQSQSYDEDRYDKEAHPPSEKAGKDAAEQG